MPPGSCVCSYWFSPSPFAAPHKPGCLLPPSWQRASCLQTRPMLSLLFFQIPRASPALSSVGPSSFPGAAPLHPAPPPASLLSKVIILSLCQAFSPLCALGFLHSWTPQIIPVHHPFCVLVLLPGRFLLVPSPTLTWLLSPRVISPPARSCARCPQLLGVLRLPPPQPAAAPPPPQGDGFSSCTSAVSSSVGSTQMGTSSPDLSPDVCFRPAEPGDSCESPRRASPLCPA